MDGALLRVILAHAKGARGTRLANAAELAGITSIARLHETTLYQLSTIRGIGEWGARTLAAVACSTRVTYQNSRPS